MRASTFLEKHGYSATTLQAVHDSALQDMQNDKLSQKEREVARKHLMDLAQAIVDMERKASPPPAKTSTNDVPPAKRAKVARGMVEAGVTLDQLKIVG